MKIIYAMTQDYLQQYQLTQGCRTIVLDFLESQVKNDCLTPVSAFDNKNILHLLEHVAYCYYNWTACFALRQPYLSRDFSCHTIQDIRDFYALADQAVGTFMETFQGKMDVPIQGHHDYMGDLRATPLQVFTHVITHEFHHKGQMMTMCRLLGYPPPDTDVSNFFIPL